MSPGVPGVLKSKLTGLKNFSSASREFHAHVAALLQQIVSPTPSHSPPMTASASQATTMPSNLDHYSALLDLLQDGRTQSRPEKLAAVAYLLHLCVKKIPKSTLMEMHTESIAAVSPLIQLLAATDASSSTTTLKFLVLTAGNLLSALGRESWEGEGEGQHEDLLIQLVGLAVDDSRLAVRAAARKVVRAQLTDSLKCAELGWHPAVALVADYLHEKCGQYPASSSGDGATRVFCLLEGILYRVPGE